MMFLSKLVTCFRNLVKFGESGFQNYHKLIGNCRRTSPVTQARPRGHRSRSRSSSLPIDRNLLMTWDYDDYVQQVSRGMRPNMYGDLVSFALSRTSCFLCLWVCITYYRQVFFKKSFVTL
ncbi:unnamed protein product [Schistosoma mattheei]|uniref:Uncharacterized protein n=1 Tax=Schistosoma mattheei TaxID=31246 RepID=A0A183NJ24_9TREM|nr:unnamed protein product [Schistosoma mattheei]